MGVKGPSSGVGDGGIEDEEDGVPGSGVGSQPSACGFSTQGSMDGSGPGWWYRVWLRFRLWF